MRRVAGAVGAVVGAIAFALAGAAAGALLLWLLAAPFDRARRPHS